MGVGRRYDRISNVRELHARVALGSSGAEAGGGLRDDPAREPGDLVSVRVTPKADRVWLAGLYLMLTPTKWPPDAPGHRPS